MTRPERLAENLEQPELDDRSYRVIRLPNKLEALLVHDPTTDKASASVNVKVGNFLDDDDMPGMAHAVEHLLFMGTRKYPEENAYSQYLSSNSGYSNAYTAATETNYFFEVAATHKSGESAQHGSVQGEESSEPSPLYGALDRFSSFFVSPLFLESTLDRELKAVDSENKKNLQSDLWRLIQLNKSLSNPGHPFHHFSTGNLQTLKIEPEKRGVDVRKEFIKFYEKHYSANRMRLVALGQDSLDQMEQWVSDLFSDVKNKDLPPSRWDHVQPYLAEDMNVQVFAKPVMDSRSIDLNFPFMDEENLFASQPSRYLSHLIGHEGPGSILSYIKGKKWANALSAGAMPVCPGTSVFTINVRLTPEGLRQYREVVKVIFEYIAMIKERQPERWVFDEMKATAEVDFRFQSKSSSGRFASHMSSVMQKPLPREWLLSGSVIRDFEPELIKQAMSYLRADNFRLTLVSQEYPGDWDQQEKWYGTPYKTEKMPEDFMEEIQKAATSTPETRLSSVHFPHKNEFIPTRLSVERKDVSEPAETPKIIRHDDRARVWFKKDDRFWVPKASLHCTLRNPLIWATPANFVKTKIYCDLVNDALVEYSYDAEIAGLDYHLSAGMMGLDIAVGGYNDKMSVLLEKVAISMRELVVDPDRFHIIKDRMLRAYRNAEYQHPYYQIMDYTRHLTMEKTWINEQYFAELEHIGPDDITAFIPALLQQNHIEVLAHGNFYKEDVLRMTDCIETNLQGRPLCKSQWLIRRNLMLPPGSNYVYERQLKDPANVNHCIEYYLLVGLNSDQMARAKLLLFSQMTDEPAFDQLRTKEQLGYVVWSGSRQSATTLGYRVIVQSDRNARYLESRINSFLSKFGDDLEKMDEREFARHKQSVINKRLEKLKNLTSETTRYWVHIASEHFDFLQHYTDVSCLKSLSKADMLDFYRRLIDPSSQTRAKLSIHLAAQGDASAESAEHDQSEVTDRKMSNGSGSAANEVDKFGLGEPTYITDVADFKANTALTSGPRPVTDLSQFEDSEAKL